MPPTVLLQFAARLQTDVDGRFEIHLAAVEEWEKDWSYAKTVRIPLYFVGDVQRTGLESKVVGFEGAWEKYEWRLVRQVPPHFHPVPEASQYAAKGPPRCVTCFRYSQGKKDVEWFQAPVAEVCGLTPERMMGVLRTSHSDAVMEVLRLQTLQGGVLKGGASGGTEGMMEPVRLTALTPKREENPQTECHPSSKAANATPLDPKRCPDGIVIEWAKPGPSTVFVCGSWDKWKARLPMQKEEGDRFFITLREGTELPLRGKVFEYRFLLNGTDWQCDTDKPRMRDPKGHENNVLDLGKLHFIGTSGTPGPDPALGTQVREPACVAPDASPTLEIPGITPVASTAIALSPSGIAPSVSVSPPKKGGTPAGKAQDFWAWFWSKPAVEPPSMDQRTMAASGEPPFAMRDALSWPCCRRGCGLLKPNTTVLQRHIPGALKSAPRLPVPEQKQGNSLVGVNYGSLLASESLVFTICVVYTEEGRGKLPPIDTEKAARQLRWMGRHALRPQTGLEGGKAACPCPCEISFRHPWDRAHYVWESAPRVDGREVRMVAVPIRLEMAEPEKATEGWEMIERACERLRVQRGKPLQFDWTGMFESFQSASISSGEFLTVNKFVDGIGEFVFKSLKGNILLTARHGYSLSRFDEPAALHPPGVSEGWSALFEGLIQVALSPCPPPPLDSHQKKTVEEAGRTQGKWKEREKDKTRQQERSSNNNCVDAFSDLQEMLAETAQKEKKPTVSRKEESAETSADSSNSPSAKTKEQKAVSPPSKEAREDKKGGEKGKDKTANTKEERPVSRIVSSHFTSPLRVRGMNQDFYFLPLTETSTQPSSSGAEGGTEQSTTSNNEKIPEAASRSPQNKKEEKTTSSSPPKPTPSPPRRQSLFTSIVSSLFSHSHNTTPPPAPEKATHPRNPPEADRERPPAILSASAMPPSVEKGNPHTAPPPSDPSLAEKEAKSPLIDPSPTAPRGETTKPLAATSPPCPSVARGKDDEPQSTTLQATLSSAKKGNQTMPSAPSSRLSLSQTRAPRETSEGAAPHEKKTEKDAAEEKTISRPNPPEANRVQRPPAESSSSSSSPCSAVENEKKLQTVQAPPLENKSPHNAIPPSNQRWRPWAAQLFPPEDKPRPPSSRRVSPPTEREKGNQKEGLSPTRALLSRALAETSKQPPPENREREGESTFLLGLLPSNPTAAATSSASAAAAAAASSSSDHAVLASAASFPFPRSVLSASQSLNGCDPSGSQARDPPADSDMSLQHKNGFPGGDAGRSQDLHGHPLSPPLNEVSPPGLLPPPPPGGILPDREGGSTGYAEGHQRPSLSDAERPVWREGALPTDTHSLLQKREGRGNGQQGGCGAAESAQVPFSDPATTVSIRHFLDSLPRGVGASLHASPPPSPLSLAGEVKKETALEAPSRKETAFVTPDRRSPAQGQGASQGIIRALGPIGSPARVKAREETAASFSSSSSLWSQWGDRGDLGSHMRGVLLPPASAQSHGREEGKER
uniref:AMP-activated protein kinase glycogen-binding domain-containing protein n=1 Tax=Chromera velia CCMP2878 TaxID=1169474 RepID=A0A0G4G7C8_9ALVE|eukprot:Cvel_20616.t1-p1 / transcript=Cvel_20616.t1 / gene=Cvel_20616 / organism=Chromera_velia_CCMP2878 / gene_product=Proline-rich receptor-like protein kinase PERK8, putative / transcript_product=Proline-rich receptor-like protein kinase PERK8, putative / location=Cvel_scaffold1866:9783-18466(+) / protein_length=1492 / sequence_SO=supercontig / SO=protein_coding / is_pseudo=false